MTHAHGPSCREMVEHLSDYLDGELDAQLREMIERHQGECPPCQAFVRTLSRTVEMIRDDRRAPLPPHLRDALARALRRAGG